jgi:hypothetical protein
VARVRAGRRRRDGICFCVVFGCRRVFIVVVFFGGLI